MCVATDDHRELLFNVVFDDISKIVCGYADDMDIGISIGIEVGDMLVVRAYDSEDDPNVDLTRIANDINALLSKDGYRVTNFTSDGLYRYVLLRVESPELSLDFFLFITF